MKHRAFKVCLPVKVRQFAGAWLQAAQQCVQAWVLSVLAPLAMATG